MKKLALLMFLLGALNVMAQYKPGQINAKFEKQRYAFINDYAEKPWVLRKQQNVLNSDDLDSFRRIYGISATMNGKDISPLTLSIIPDCAEMKIRFMFDSDAFVDGFELDLSRQMVMYAYDLKNEQEFSVVTKKPNGEIMWMSFANPKTGDNTVTMVRHETGKLASVLPLSLKLTQEQYDLVLEYLLFLNEHSFICGEPYAPNEDDAYGLTPEIEEMLEEILEEDAVFEVVEKKPHFPGDSGDGSKMGAWMSKNLRYPVIAAENRIQGTVHVQFIVGKDGSINNPTIAKSSSNKSLDEEAIRVVKAMPKWVPGNHQGKPVSVKYTLPIQFRLP